MYACMHAGSDHHHDSEALQLGGLDPRVSPDELTRQLVLQHALKLQEGPRREVRFSSLLVVRMNNYFSKNQLAVAHR